MKYPSRFWLLGAALLLGILLLAAAGCVMDSGKSGSLTFRFQVDPSGSTYGQLPAEAQKVDLEFQWNDWYDAYLLLEEAHSFQVDNSQKRTQEQTYENMATGRFHWKATVYAVQDSKEYRVGTARGEFSTTYAESWDIEVQYPLRDANLTLQVGIEDPEAKIYSFTISSQDRTYDVFNSPPVDSDENPSTWEFSLPSGDYSYSARSYNDDCPDYPYYKDEDLSQWIPGAVHLDPGESKTIVVDFDPQPVPDPPGGLEAELTAAHADSIVISWSAVPGADSYNLYWATTPGVTKATGTKIPGVSSGFIHGPLPRGFTYYYVLTAVKGSKESDISVEASVEVKPG